LEEQQFCFAILILSSMFWAFEVVPLFVTSMMIPFLAVLFRVIRNPETNQRLTSKAAAKIILSEMFSPVIMLLLGGFTIAAALSKHHLAKRMASTILKKAGTSPSMILITNMGVASFASMWISNVAAPVLCFSLIQPILRTLPHRSPYAKCLIMGIALASNIGGMSSPIASPQNIIAIQNMNPAPNWLVWFMVTLPLCLLLDVMIAFLLIVIYKPGNYAGLNAPPEVYHEIHGKLSWKQYYVLFVTLLTIFFWCIESIIEEYIGEMGIVAIVPMILFFGTGILTKEDFNNFLWTVIMLAMGGISLGFAVKSSGLLKTITDLISPHLNGLSSLDNSIFRYSLYLLLLWRNSLDCL
jgi:anion transporter